MKNFLIYKSSAGSGKTYILVKEYLKLVLGNPDNFRHTLAVTFTNKAAEEMKIRIINSLVEISGGRGEKLKEQLISEGIGGDIRQKAGDVLQKILHHYSYFSVSTIDSFFHKIIRAFAKELKLQLGYNVELDNDIVLNKIVDELLDEIGANMELTKYLEDYVFFSIDDKKGWNIDAKIKGLGDEIFKERYWIKKGNGTDLADSRVKMLNFIGTLFSIIKDFEGSMNDISSKAGKILEKFELRLEDFPYGKSGFMNYLMNKISNDKYEPTSRVFDAYNNINKWHIKKSSPKVLKAANDGLYELLNLAVDNYNNLFRKYKTAKELVKTIYILGIFNDLLDKLKDYRDENRLMLISDTNNILMKVISGDNSPFIYEKTGTIYKNFLIDEFQDTSTFQWKNFLPLIENSLSENNFSMIVGDVKQSIYRWRNGNMKLLLGEAREDLGNFDEVIHEKALSENFRSKREIIKFNNEFFKNASEKLAERIKTEDKDLITDSYKEVKQDFENSAEGGYINISFVNADEEDNSLVNERALNKLIETVKDVLNSGYKQRDILVLVRYRSEGSEAAHYLTEAGFKVVSNDSLLLTNSSKVKLLISLFKYISDYKNNLAKTEILYNYSVYIKNDDYELNEIFNDYKIQSSSLFTKKLPEEFFSQSNPGKLNSKFYSLNLYELTENLIRIFGLNDTTDAYLLRFLDIIHEYSAKNSSGITGFIEWWEENKEKYSIIIPEAEDAVRIMTIHISKGLQSPVVILPFANWEMDLKFNRDLLWASSDHPPFNSSSAFIVSASSGLRESYFEKDFNEESALTNLDNLNLLYVAFTRAEERLYAVVPEKGTNAYSAGKLIYEALHSGEEFSRYFVNPEEFETGSKTKYMPKKEKDSGTYMATGFISTDLRDKIVTMPLSKEVKLEKEKEYLQLKNRGIILHKALSYINVPDDAERAVAQLKIEGLITEENEEKLMNELMEILNVSEVKKWFSNDYEIKSESEIILPNGDIYRPDRVLLKDNTAILIDYKTGSENKEHIKQVNLYADALNQMGYKNITKYLFYVTARKVIKI